MRKLNVSVIIPVFNAEPFLRRAVESALQFKEVKEVILIEDNSTDNSLAICQALESNPKVNLFRHPSGENLGAAASRNLGIQKANSEYLSFLDADDFYLSNRFEGEIQTLKECSFEGMYGVQNIFYNSDRLGEQHRQFFSGREITKVNEKTKPKDLFEGLLGLRDRKFGYFHLNTLTVKKIIIDDMGYRFNPILRLHQDTEFIIRLSYYADLLQNPINEPIAVRVVHDNNRITKDRYKTKAFIKNKILLWKSLYYWAKKDQIPKSYIKYFYRTLLPYQLADSTILKAWVLLICSLPRNIIILKEYRLYLKRMLFLE